MTRLELADGGLTGLLAWCSLIHVPDVEMPTVLAEFHRVLRPGGVILLGFHAGDGSRLKTEGYGGHPMNVYVYRRPTARVAAWLDAAGFTVEAEMTHRPASNVEGGFIFARRRDGRGNHCATASTTTPAQPITVALHDTAERAAADASPRLEANVTPRWA